MARTTAGRWETVTLDSLGFDMTASVYFIDNGEMFFVVGKAKAPDTTLRIAGFDWPTAAVKWNNLVAGTLGATSEAVTLTTGPWGVDIIVGGGNGFRTVNQAALKVRIAPTGSITRPLSACRPSGVVAYRYTGYFESDGASVLQTGGNLGTRGAALGLWDSQGQPVGGEVFFPNDNYSTNGAAARLEGATHYAVCAAKLENIAGQNTFVTTYKSRTPFGDFNFTDVGGNVGNYNACNMWECQGGGLLAYYAVAPQLFRLGYSEPARGILWDVPAFDARSSPNTGIFLTANTEPVADESSLWITFNTLLGGIHGAFPSLFPSNLPRVQALTVRIAKDLRAADRVSSHTNIGASYTQWPMKRPDCIAKATPTQYRSSAL